MNKKIYMGVALLSLSAIVGVTFASLNDEHSIATIAGKRTLESPYTLVIDASKKDFRTGPFSVETELGNSIGFDSLADINHGTGELISNDPGGIWFGNDVVYSGEGEILNNLILNITSVTVEFTNGDVSNPLIIYAETDVYADSSTHMDNTYYIFYDDVDEIELTSGVACTFTGELPNAFAIYSDSTSVSLSKVTITYLCA